MANPSPSLKGRRPGQLNKSTIERELKVRAAMQHMIDTGQAKASSFTPGDSLAWMEAMARNADLDMQERRQFAIAAAPYQYARKNAIQVDPRTEEDEVASLTVDELLALEAQAKGILLEHDPSPNEGD